MSLRLQLALPSGVAPALGPCFICRRSALTTIRIGTMSSPGGPGHRAYETPLFACRSCLGHLTLIHHTAHADPARPYVAAGHPS
ncbi:hypothetical protein [Streptomyces sp. NRRL F-5135]|uniref:hypothetical protein n=1 Tax=Streptomyces sp. NRRL F-5135 TaxID=1463858 RepID=UPI00069124E3|nr:hypothetical protein [Streptomyces sp. NRRL F-5135]